jgi:hypothetical protein
MITKRVLACAVMVFAFAAGTVLAQSKSGDDTSTRGVEGQVLDKGGAPVSGAVVQLKDTKTLQIRSFNTQQNGAYHFAGLSPNVDYELKADRDGVSSGVKTLTVFDSHKLATINLKLDRK